VTPAQFQAFAGVSRETLQGFVAYHDLLVKWQARINLIAPATLPEIWERHFADSAQIFPFLPPEAVKLVDMGSGAGFPGLVLALLARDRARPIDLHLVEADGRKAAFLIEAARLLGLLGQGVVILAQRAERLAAGPLAGRVDVVVARALAPLAELLALAAPLLTCAGHALFLKGERAEAECADARATGWHFALASHPSRLPGGGALLDLTTPTQTLATPAGRLL
jgi:16S rRNA (guanine527-N7)-methyltransferase